MDLEQMEQLVSHSVVGKTGNTRPTKHMYSRTIRRQSHDFLHQFQI